MTTAFFHTFNTLCAKIGAHIEDLFTFHSCERQYMWPTSMPSALPTWVRDEYVHAHVPCHEHDRFEGLGGYPRPQCVFNGP